MTKLKEMDSSFRFCRSVTTRNKRPGEIEGVSYFFIQKEEYERMDKNVELIESIQYLGNNYGTRYDEIDKAIENGENLIMILEAHGMHQIKEHYKESCICIFMFPPSIEDLRYRLIKRGRETPEQIEERLLNARVELKTSSDYDYFVVNDIVDHCACNIFNIVKECYAKDESKKA